MSVGVREMANTPSSVITIASTMKVYGRRSARRTIHMWPATVAREGGRHDYSSAAAGYR